LIKVNQKSIPKIILYICICLFGFIFGAKFYLLGYTHHYKHFFEALLYEPSETINNYFEKTPPEDTLYFYISQKNYMKLSSDRERRIGLTLDWIRTPTVFNQDQLYKEEVNSNLYYRKNKMRAKIKIQGILWDHFLHPSKWSMRVKLKDKNSFKGTKQFNLLKPETRGNLIGFIVNEIAKKYNIISIGYSPVQVIINGKNMGIFLFEDFFNKYLIEKNSKTDSIIFSISDQKSKEKEHDDLKILHPNPRKLDDGKRILINNINNQVFSYDRIIDEEKLIVLLALGFIFESWHHFYPTNLNFYYNPHTNLIEPIIRELQPSHKVPIINDLNREEIEKKIKLLTKLNPYLSNYVEKYIYDNLFIPKLIQTIDDIIKEYFYIISSDKFKKYDSILNTESITSSWRTNIGTNNIKYLSSALSKNDILLQTPDSGNYSSLIDTIIFKGDLIINETYIINGDEVLIIEEGSNVKFQNNSNIIIYGNIQILGSKKNPVMITNIDDSNSSIVAIETFGTNNIFHTNFENFSSLHHKNWMNTASLTFYESDVIIKDVKFSKNIKGDDYLNIVRTDSYLIENCEFNNILFDAIDIDYSDGKIVNSTFKYIGNDAIDFSGSTSDVFNCTFSHCGDKAISCGESSLVDVANCKISVSKFGIVSKDLSFVEALNNKFKGNEFDFGIYQKKDEFGTGRLEDIRSIGTLTVLMGQNAVFKSDNDKVTIIKYDGLIHNTQSKSR
jgi:hypothetical protein